MGALQDESVDMELALPWRLICALACQSLIEGKSLDRLIEESITDYLNR